MKKTTLYVALERLIDMSDASSWKLNRTLASSLISHRSNCQLVAAFAPHRFGLFFETREEIDEAWNYIHSFLKKRGIEFETRYVLLKNNGDTSEFSATEEAWWLAGKEDEKTWSPNLRIIHEMPSAATPISTRLKQILTAAFLHD